MSGNLVINTQVSSQGQPAGISQSVIATYPIGSTISQTLVLNPGGQAGNQFASPVGFSALTLNVSGPVQLTATKGTDVGYLDQIVNTLLQVDDTVDSFQLTNSGTSAVAVQMVFVVSAGGVAPPIPGIVTSVNGRTGAVTLTYTDIAGLATVAHTGDYNDLINKPTPYVLPVASTNTLGGVRQGAGVTIDPNGILSANVLTVAGRTGNVTLAVADVAGAVALSDLAAPTGATLIGYGSETVKQALDDLNAKLTNALVSTTLVCTSVGQTVYPVPGGYPIGLVDLYALGAHLIDGDDYSATDGQNIVLTAGNAARIPVGGKLLLNSLSSFSVADAVDLATLGGTNGANLVGYGAETVKQALDTFNQLLMADYTALRAYAGPLTSVFVTTTQINGQFKVDLTDTTTADNSGTCIVDALGRRWKRLNIQAILCSWFTVSPNYVINSAAVAAAHAASKLGGTIPKLPIYANGVTIDTPVVLDGGDDLVHNADLGCVLDATLLNVSITPGVGTAITIRNARKPRWRISINGSGTEHNQVDTSNPPQVVLAGTDIAVSHYNVEGAEFDLEGYNFRGILSYYNGANGQWLENKSARILGRTCFQTVNWTGQTITGDAAVGVINSIWDVIPFFRSQISWLGDLNIHHYESSVVNTFQLPGGSLEISHVGSCHLGKINLGNNAQYMMRVFGASSQVDIDHLYCLGNGTIVNGKSNGDSTTNGLEIADTSFVSIGSFVGSQCNTAFAVDGGARLAIGTFNGNNNTWDMGLQQGLSSGLSMDIDIGTYHSNGVYNGSVQYRGNVTGRLAIDKGFIRNGNVTASTTIPAIDLTGVSASFFFAPGGLTIDSSWTIGVSHYYLGSVLAKGGNQIACTTPLIDSFGHKGGSDLITLVMPLPTTPPVFGTTYTNTLPYAMLLYVPISFGSASVVGDYAAVKLTDPFGTVYDLASRISVNMGVLPNIATLGPILVGPGWSFTLSASNTGANRVALQSTQTPYWIRT